MVQVRRADQHADAARLGGDQARHVGQDANRVCAAPHGVRTVGSGAPVGRRLRNAARRGARSRGIGARLLEPFLARADREDVGIYLESSNPRNLSFYQRYDFENYGEAIVLPGAGPLLQPMWRRAPSDR